MPINQADARQLAQVMLLAYGEDIEQVVAILRPLIAQWPSIDWMGELRTVAATHQGFIDSGLSVQWWLNEVERRLT